MKIPEKIKNKKIVAVIPARLGSNRVKAKNLRLINGKPLIYYAINATKNTPYFSEIYINSESQIFGLIAERYGVKFYNRPPELATSQSMIDEYIYNFLKNIKCDILAVVNPTSPFIQTKEIEAAIENFIELDYDTQLACEDIRTHSFYKNVAVNFSISGKHPRSQDLEPVKALNFAITLWKSKSFIEQYEKYGHAVYTGEIGLYSFSGLSTIDIDWEEDFVLAEIIMENYDNLKYKEPKWDTCYERYH